ncbi:hypothetical protein MHK_003478, partial [Candidatus Magnetomorum sp. HK-1]
MTIDLSSGLAGNSVITMTVDDGGTIVQTAFDFSVLSPFTEVESISLSGVYYSSSVFGDYDNDGDLDILLTGSTGSIKLSKVYRNTGGSFSEYTGINLTGVYFSSAAFGDYDNDGDLDILLTGYSGSSFISKVYRNTGGSFSEYTG